MKTIGKFILWVIAGFLLFYVPSLYLAKWVKGSDPYYVVEHFIENSKHTSYLLLAFAYALLPFIFVKAFSLTKHLVQKWKGKGDRIYTLLATVVVYALLLLAATPVFSRVIPELYLHLHRNFELTNKMLTDQQNIYLERSRYDLTNYLIAPVGGTATTFCIFPDSVRVDSTLMTAEPLAISSFWGNEGYGFIDLSNIKDGRYLLVYSSCHWGSELYFDLRTK